MAKTPKVDKVQEAQKILAEETKKKIEACAKDIEQVLKKHGFTLQVSPSQIYLSPSK